MSAWSQRGILFITGTGTGVGKTIVTAAVATLAAEAGRRVAVVKVAQTGVYDGPGSDTPDLETVTRLSGVTDTHELARFPDPLSPEAAARVSGRPPVDLEHARKVIGDLAVTRDLVLVEGAGGLLVRYDADGSTIAGLAAALNAEALVVVSAGLGTLNHTALTLEAMREHGVISAGIVIGSWPRDPGLAERENLTDLRQPFIQLAIDSLDQVGDRLQRTGKALAPQLTAANEQALQEAIPAAVSALTQYRAWLTAKLPTARKDTAIGRDNFLFFLRKVALLPYTPEQLLAMSQQEWSRAVAFEAYQQTRLAGVPPAPFFPSAAAQIQAEKVD